MKPKDVSDVDMTFPASVKHMMPKWEEIPEEFKRGHGKWNDLMSDWFDRGLKSLSVTPKEGIDQNKAIRHLSCILRSFEPKHEHKEAAVAYLMSQWFEDATWEPAK